MSSFFQTLVALTVIIAACFGIGIIEEKDMKEINQTYFDLDMSDPHSVIEYLHLIATKPQWRVGVMVSSVLAIVLTSLYVYSKEVQSIPAPVYFFCCMTMAWILMCGYMSFYGFHVVAPNGGQEISNKLRDPTKPCKAKFSGAKARHFGSKPVEICSQHQNQSS